MSKRLNVQRGRSDQKKKRLKKYACAKERYTSSSSAFAVEPNMAGMFITCNRAKESSCVKEMYDLFHEYEEKLYPSEVATDAAQGETETEPDLMNNNNEEEDEDEDDIESSIAKEVARMKKPHKQNRFANMNVGIDCVVFIKSRPPVQPVSFVSYILHDLAATGKKKSRYSHRIVPVERTCYANMPDIEAMAKELLAPHFHQIKGEQLEPVPKKFAVVPKMRNNDRIDRDELIRRIAMLVGPPHIVDLNTPELYIIVEIFKSICAMSVVTEYYELKRFNLQTIFETTRKTKGNEAGRVADKQAATVKVDQSENEADEPENAMDESENTVGGPESAVEGPENEVDGSENRVDGPENAMDGPENEVVDGLENKPENEPENKVTV